jgi:hypothetical protein
MFTMVFKYFSSVFAIVSYACFKCLIYFFCMIASGCFKSRLSVVHGLRVESGWRHGQCSGRRGPIAGALAREQDTLGAHSLPVRGGSESDLQALASP